MNLFPFGVSKKGFIPLVIEGRLFFLPLINGVNDIIDSRKKIVDGDVL
jgi:hypothetical protein